MRNSSYSFMPILLKLYRCFCHDLKICMWFGYYPEIIFCHFFCNLNLVIFKCFYYQSEKIVGTLCAQLHSCFGHGLKICMWFGYTPDSTLQSTYTLVRQILSKSNITNVTLLILSIGNRSLCGVVVKLIAL